MAVGPELTGSHSSDSISRWRSTKEARGAPPPPRCALPVCSDRLPAEEICLNEEEESLQPFCSSSQIAGMSCRDAFGCRFGSARRWSVAARRVTPASATPPRTATLALMLTLTLTCAAVTLTEPGQLSPSGPSAIFTSSSDGWK